MKYFLCALMVSGVLFSAEDSKVDNGAKLLADHILENSVRMVSFCNFEIQVAGKFKLFELIDICSSLNEEFPKKVVSCNIIRKDERSVSVELISTDGIANFKVVNNPEYKIGGGPHNPKYLFVP